MELEKHEMRLFSSVDVPEIFISDYMQLLDSDSIKVYLYLLFAQKNNIDFDLLDLSKRLGSTIDVIKSSFEKLDNLQLVLKKPNGYIIKDIREIELNNLYSPKLTSSLEDAVNKAENNKDRLNAINIINNTYFQGTMSPSWFTDIDMMFEKYGFSNEVVIALINDCYGKGTLNHKYAMAVANTWNQNRIKSFDDLEKYFMTYEKRSKLKKQISKKLGLNRNLTEYEEAYVDKWSNDYKYSLDIIELALKKTTSKANPSFTYIDKILSDWNEHSLKTVEEINNFNKGFNEKDKFIKQFTQVTKENKLNGYSTKRQLNNLNQFCDNIKIGGD